MPITTKAGRFTARYWIDNRVKPPAHLDSIPLINYTQLDVHTCGFVAALTVAHYFDPQIDAKTVLAAICPSPRYGANGHKMMKGLRSLGIEIEYRTDLTITELRRYVRHKIPVLISVWEPQMYSDHWTLVSGFDDEYIHLTNYGSLLIHEFYEQWSDFDMRSGYGASSEGIVCKRVR